MPGPVSAAEVIYWRLRYSDGEHNSGAKCRHLHLGPRSKHMKISPETFSGAGGQVLAAKACSACLTEAAGRSAQSQHNHDHHLRVHPASLGERPQATRQLADPIFHHLHHVGSPRDWTIMVP